MTEPLTDPREMRKAIQRATRGESLLGNGEVLAGPGPMARNVLMAANHAGLSGEDMMTALAYHAMREVERMQKMMLDDLMTRHSAPLIVRVEPNTGKPA